MTNTTKDSTEVKLQSIHLKLLRLAVAIECGEDFSELLGQLAELTEHLR